VQTLQHLNQLLNWILLVWISSDHLTPESVAELDQSIELTGLDQFDLFTTCSDWQDHPCFRGWEKLKIREKTKEKPHSPSFLLPLLLYEALYHV
jgi:hypothetical protein